MEKNTQDIVEQRKVIHIDMDAFFASVEQREQPDLKGKPVIVGGRPESRGVVAACSYEARKYGIHSAMPSSRAYKLCPRAVFVRPRIALYRTVSEQIRAVFRQYTELVEPLSLDEAYLDVTHSTEHSGSATRIAEAIKAEIFEQTQLTASAGVSYNKFLAKIASDMDKPNGLYRILPAEGMDFVASLPVKKFHGIGKATAAKMEAMEIYTGKDLRRFSEEELLKYFGKVGRHYFNICRGVDHRQVNPVRERKSIGSETTLKQDTNNREQVIHILEELCAKVSQMLDDKILAAKTITLKLKYSNFELITRSSTQSHPIADAADLLTAVIPLIEKTELGLRSVRLVGVSASNLTEPSAQIEAEQFYLL